MDWNQSSIISLLQAYKSEIILYDIKHEMYHNKNARLQSLQNIVNKIKGERPNVTVVDVKNKINSIRTHYAAEKNKINIRRKQRLWKQQQLQDNDGDCSSVGSNTAEYYPTVWWYNYVQFLDQYVTPRKLKAATRMNYNNMTNNINNNSNINNDMVIIFDIIHKLKF